MVHRTGRVLVKDANEERSGEHGASAIHLQVGEVNIAARVVDPYLRGHRNPKVIGGVGYHTSGRGPDEGIRRAAIGDSLHCDRKGDHDLLGVVAWAYLDYIGPWGGLQRLRDGSDRVIRLLAGAYHVCRSEER